MSATNWPHVINLGNSIIGVSLLAMPFCFKQCGLVLGMTLLIGCGTLTSMSCGLLMRAANTSKKRSYEFLGYHTFGPAGKLCVELCTIGLLLGTCIAFHVIIGDLGPAMLSKMLHVENNSELRIGLMVCLGLFVALPLGLLRNLGSLSNISAMSVAFYGVFVLEVFATAFPNLWSGIWVTKVQYWNPEGVFKCLPIFSLAFSCQSQLFILYDAMGEPSLKTITSITKSAVMMCVGFYLCVGYFGYVAFCDEEISGDILMNFRPTIFSDSIKMGFVLSVAVSFPLVIFPCRASIYMLFFAKHARHENLGGGQTIPELHFRLITAAIVIATLIVGIYVPNVEFVLGLTGATMGSLICYIFPAIMFINIMSTETKSKPKAQMVLFLGVTILLASTYVILYTQDKVVAEESVVKIAPPDLPPLDNGPINSVEHLPKSEDKKVDEDTKIHDTGQEKDKEGKRQEPPVPQAPLDDDKPIEVDKKNDVIEKEKLEEKKDEDIKDEEMKDVEIKDEEKKSLEKPEKKDEPKVEKKFDIIDPDKDDKEKKELKEKEKVETKEKEDTKKEKEDEKADKAEAKKILQELQAQQKEQKELIQEQKQIIEELKQHQKVDQDHLKQDMEKMQEQSNINGPPGDTGIQQQQQQPIVQQQQQPILQQLPIVQQQQLPIVQQQPVVQQQQPNIQQQPIIQQQQQPLGLQPVQQPLQNQRQPVQNVPIQQNQPQQVQQAPQQQIQNQQQNILQPQQGNNIQPQQGNNIQPQQGNNIQPQQGNNIQPQQDNVVQRQPQGDFHKPQQPVEQNREGKLLNLIKGKPLAGGPPLKTRLEANLEQKNVQQQVGNVPLQERDINVNVDVESPNNQNKDNLYLGNEHPIPANMAPVAQGDDVDMLIRQQNNKIVNANHLQADNSVHKVIPQPADFPDGIRQENLNGG